MSNGIILDSGLSDFLFVTFFSLSLYKAFGRTAGIINTLFGLLVIASLLLINQEWPGMIFLAPLILGQYLFWHHRYPTDLSDFLFIACFTSLLSVDGTDPSHGVGSVY